MLVEQGAVMFELYINQDSESHSSLLNIMMRLNLPDSKQLAVLSTLSYPPLVPVEALDTRLLKWQPDERLYIIPNSSIVNVYIDMSTWWIVVISPMLHPTHGTMLFRLAARGRLLG